MVEMHTNTLKLICNISTITNVFLNQKRVNVCEYMVKMMQERVSERGCERGRWGEKRESREN
jgi:hypothetical protein